MRSYRWIMRNGVLAMLAVIMTNASAEPAAIRVGASRHDVRARLGAPERVGVLRGKLIESVAAGDEDRVAGRLVYYYRDGQLMIWFENGKVTSVVGSEGSRDENQDDSTDH